MSFSIESVLYLGTAGEPVQDIFNIRTTKRIGYDHWTFVLNRAPQIVIFFRIFSYIQGRNATMADRPLPNVGSQCDTQGLWNDTEAMPALESDISDTEDMSDLERDKNVLGPPLKSLGILGLDETVFHYDTSLFPIAIITEEPSIVIPVQPTWTPWMERKKSTGTPASPLGLSSMYLTPTPDISPGACTRKVLTYAPPPPPPPPTRQYIPNNEHSCSCYKTDNRRRRPRPPAKRKPAHTRREKAVSLNHVIAGAPNRNDDEKLKRLKAAVTQ